VDKFSVLSSQIGELYPASVRSKMVVIPNSVVPASSFSDPEGKGVFPKIILNVGRLVDFKDQNTLIDAFALIADKCPDWNLRIVGEGELRAKLEKQVYDYGLSDRISLPGNSDKIDEEYNGAHIFVVPSLYEGFGLVTAEAASHGLPCIGFSDCLGTNELIEDGATGILVDPTERVKNLAEAINMLIDNADLRERMGEAGRERVLAYAPENINDLWEMTFDAMSVC
jgi:glycosyltransferase involved in cell wall biosynthesis